MYTTTLATTGMSTTLMLSAFFSQAVLPILIVGTALTLGIIALNFGRLVRNEKRIKGK